MAARKSTRTPPPMPAAYIAFTLRDVLALIPDRELDTTDFLLVRLAPREGKEGYAVAGVGALEEMLLHAAAHVVENANEVRIQ